MIENSAGNTYAAGVRKPFQSCGPVDPIAVDIRSLCDDVAKIDTDTEPDAFAVGQIRLMPGH